MVLNASETKLLEAVKDNPGLKWYEFGAIVYPRSVKNGDLVGSGLSYTYRGANSLLRKKLVRTNKEFGHFITIEGRRWLGRCGAPA